VRAPANRFFSSVHRLAQLLGLHASVRRFRASSVRCDANSLDVCEKITRRAIVPLRMSRAASLDFSQLIVRFGRFSTLFSIIYAALGVYRVHADKRSRKIGPYGTVQSIMNTICTV
jgi:hypothetical protein